MAEENKNSKFKQEYYDTFDMMSQDEREELILIQKIKSNVKYFVGTEKIIEKISELIDDSNTVSFSAERNRKYISKKNPLFILKVNKNKIKEKLVYFDNDEKCNDYFVDNHLNQKYEKDVTYIQDHIREEIIEPYSKWLLDFLLDNEKFMNICKENGLEEIKLNKDILKLIITTSAVMFAIKVDLKNNKVFLEYAI